MNANGREQIKLFVKHSFYEILYPKNEEVKGIFRFLHIDARLNFFVFVWIISSLRKYRMRTAVFLILYYIVDLSKVRLPFR